MSASPDHQAPPGVVELREDVPLKAGSSPGGSAPCAAGPRLILAAFAALSAAITLALLTQIYYGDYEVVPHGSVSGSGAACSRAGTGALRAGGRALDAAAAAALCLAVLAPHRTSLDASGSLLYWEYRSSRTQLPTLAEWGGPATDGGAAAAGGVAVGGAATAAGDVAAAAGGAAAALSGAAVGGAAVGGAAVGGAAVGGAAVGGATVGGEAVGGAAVGGAAVGGAAVGGAAVGGAAVGGAAVGGAAVGGAAVGGAAVGGAAVGGAAVGGAAVGGAAVGGAAVGGAAVGGAAVGAAAAGGAAATAGYSTRPPRLLAALAALHARYGALPWPQLLQPAIDIARIGFPVSEGLAAAAAARGLAGYLPGERRTEPALADYLESLQLNSSAQLCAAWGCETSVRLSGAGGVRAGAWRVWGGGAGGRAAAAALAAAFPPPPAPPPAPADAQARVVAALQQQALLNAKDWPSGVASGLAVVDPLDTYAALVTGLSTAFGSDGAAGGGGWVLDSPHAPLDLAPALLVEDNICGTRYVMGAESGAALAQSAALALAGGAAADAAESPRVALRPDGPALEAARPPPELPALAALAALAAARNATPPYAAVNLVQQRGDALLSHADSRGGGLASRF